MSTGLTAINMNMNANVNVNLNANVKVNGHSRLPYVKDSILRKVYSILCTFSVAIS